MGNSATEVYTRILNQLKLLWSKADIGLSNVDNTPDSSKPISTAQQAAFNGLETSIANEATARSQADQSLSDEISAVGAQINGLESQSNKITSIGGNDDVNYTSESAVVGYAVAKAKVFTNFSDYDDPDKIPNGDAIIREEGVPIRKIRIPDGQEFVVGIESNGKKSIRVTADAEVELLLTGSSLKLDDNEGETLDISIVGIGTLHFYKGIFTGIT